MGFFTVQGPRILIRGVVDETWAALDGRANAPTGAAQYPNLFSGYATRPPWQVAGVDYRVGINTGVTLKIPNVDTTPTGCSLDVGNKKFHMDDDNLTVDGWDFTGWSCIPLGDNGTIRNCKFVYTEDMQDYAIDSDIPTNNLTVEYCDIILNIIDPASRLYAPVASGGAGLDGACIHYSGVGTYIVRYCWIRKAHQDLIDDYNNTAGNTAIYKYNLLEDSAWADDPDVHGDWTAFINGPFSWYCLFNTAIQNPTPGGAGAQGFTIDPEVGGPEVLNLVEVAYNTTICTTSGLAIMFSVDRGDLAAGTPGTYENHHNYFDVTGAIDHSTGTRGAPGDGDARTSFHDNVNLVTGSLAEND